jgi:hypothetical protein
MRDPEAGPFSFTKPLPLRDMVTICNSLWDEEGLFENGGVGGGGGAAPRRR